MTHKIEKSRTFLTYFDCLGFECIIDITSYENQKLLSDISGKKFDFPVSLRSMMMRARFNPQRAPEIWSFGATVDQATMMLYAEENPQALVDMIRERGNCLFKTSPTTQVIK
jgi:hypothetical protein